LMSTILNTPDEFNSDVAAAQAVVDTYSNLTQAEEDAIRAWAFKQSITGMLPNIDTGSIFNLSNSTDARTPLHGGSLAVLGAGASQSKATGASCAADEYVNLNYTTGDFRATMPPTWLGMIAENVVRDAVDNSNTTWIGSKESAGPVIELGFKDPSSGSGQDNRLIIAIDNAFDKLNAYEEQDITSPAEDIYVEGELLIGGASDTYTVGDLFRDMYMRSSADDMAELKALTRSVQGGAWEPAAANTVPLHLNCRYDGGYTFGTGGAADYQLILLGINNPTEYQWLQLGSTSKRLVRQLTA